MQITCPECQFTRVVDESKIPARSQVATCPKCQTKFQFRELPPEEPEFDIEPEEAAEAADQDTGQPAQATLPLETPAGAPTQEQPHEDAVDESSTPEQFDAPSVEQVFGEDEHREEGGEAPLFPQLSEPEQKETPKIQHPSGEIWEKLHNMTPPGQREEDNQPAQSPFDDEPANQASPQQPEHQPEQPVPGWTGEFNEEFPDPMQEDSDQEGEDGQSPLVPPPFEQLDRYGFFHGLYMTIKLVLTSPRLFYSVMPVGGGFSKPLTFTILVTMIQTFVQYFWGMAGLSSPAGTGGGEQITGMAGALAPVFMLLLLPAFVAASQFLLTGFYHLLLSLMRAGNQGFEGTFRALAYSNTPIILGLFPMFTPQIEMGWMFIVGLWGLFLTIIGLKHIHKTSYAKVIPVTIIPLLLAMILGLLAIQSGVATV